MDVACGELGGDGGGAGAAWPAFRFSAALLAALLALVAAPVPCARAQTVHPAGAEVPANLLRFSVEFDHPRRAAGMAGVLVTTRDGRPLDGAVYPQPLWSPDGRVLTLYLDPGRVKTGLDRRAAAGPVLLPGETVQVRVDGRVVHSWRVAPARTGELRLEAAPVRVPRAGTRDPLVARFASPIDFLGREMVAVEGPDRLPVSGRVSLSSDERTWTFEPAGPWLPGGHAVRVHPELEDAEGNRLGRSFETSTGPASVADVGARIPFVVAAAGRAESEPGPVSSSIVEGKSE